MRVKTTIKLSFDLPEAVKPHEALIRMATGLRAGAPEAVNVRVVMKRVSIKEAKPRPIAIKAKRRRP